MSRQCGIKVILTKAEYSLWVIFAMRRDHIGHDPRPAVGIAAQLRGVRRILCDKVPHRVVSAACCTSRVAKYFHRETIPHKSIL